MVYVTKDDANATRSLQKILEWASSAVDMSYNQPSRKTLIIVMNMLRDVPPSGHAMGDEENEMLYLYGHHDVVWKSSDVLGRFVDKYNKLVKLYDRVMDNKKLYSVLFNEVNCCSIPDRRGKDVLMASDRAERIYRHFQALHVKVEAPGQEEQLQRVRRFAERNVPTLTHI